jgi:hypothetical protein
LSRNRFAVPQVWEYIMEERVIEIEADSLEEARHKLYTADLIVLEETIICHGKVETIEAIADTVEAAFKKAQTKVPTAGKIEARKTQLTPKRITLLVQADDEEGAGKDKAELITSVSLFKKGRKGIWGFGRTSNLYEVVVSQPAVVELTFREKTKIRARVRNYFAENLLESIQRARETDTELTEILELLNPKRDSEIHSWLTKLHELNPVSVLDAIEMTCRNDGQTNWKIVVKETHTQALIVRARELRERELRLRDLDVRIADSYGLFTSIDWYAKGQQEPTGLPRYVRDYDHHRHPDERLRKIIPRYSTDSGAFGEVERRIQSQNLYQLYLRALFEEGQDDATATLEQKCVAALKARSPQ